MTDQLIGALVGLVVVVTQLVRLELAARAGRRQLADVQRAAGADKRVSDVGHTEQPIPASSGEPGREPVDRRRPIE